MAHITGGGLEYNTNRVIPKDLTCSIDWSTWKRPEIFAHIQNMGKLHESEMREVYNCGIGYVAIVNPEITNRVIARFDGVGIKSIKIGNVLKRM